MSTDPPNLTDPRQMARVLLAQLVKSKTVATVLYDLGEGTSDKPAITLHAEENYKLEPAVTSYRKQDEDTELGKTATISVDPVLQDISYLNEISVTLTLPELEIDNTKVVPDGTAIGYIENFAHHLFTISIHLNSEKIYTISNSIFDLVREIMPEHEQSAYDKCIGNVDGLLTNRVAAQESRRRVDGYSVVFPIHLKTLLPLMIQKNEQDRIRIVIESKPLLDIVHIRNVAPATGESVITKNDIRTLNRMGQQVQLGDVNYELIYKLTTVHPDFTVPKTGMRLFERYHQVESRDIKNILEDGEIIEIFPGVHSKLYCMFRNKTLESMKTVTGAEQSMYTTNPLINSGREVLKSTHIKISGNETLQESDAVFTNRLFPLRTHRKVFGSGRHLIYNYGVEDKNLSGLIDTNNLRPKIQFKFTDIAKDVEYLHPFSGVKSKPKYEVILIMSETCGLYYNPDTPTRFIPSRGDLGIKTMPSLKRDGEGTGADSVATKKPKIVDQL